MLQYVSNLGPSLPAELVLGWVWPQREMPGAPWKFTNNHYPESTDRQPEEVEGN